MSYSRCFVLLLLICALCLAGCGSKISSSNVASSLASRTSTHPWPPSGSIGDQNRVASPSQANTGRPPTATRYYYQTSLSPRYITVDASLITSNLAHQVKTLKGAAFPGQFSNPEGYPVVWLSDNKFIVAGGGATATSHGIKAVDISNGSTKIMPGLSAAASGVLLATSPDGKWILWHHSTPGYGAWTLFATRIADGKTVSWPIQAYDAGVNWLSDSRHIISVGRTFQRVNPITKLPISALDISIFDAVTGATTHDLFPGVNLDIKNVCVQNSGNPIMYGSQTFYGSANAIELCKLVLNSNPPRMQTLVVHVPWVPSAPPGSFCLSPNADRIIWCFYALPPNFNPRSRKAQTTDIFYETNIDGSHAEPVGYLLNGACFNLAMNSSPAGDKVAMYLNNGVAIVSLPKTTLVSAGNVGEWFDVPSSQNGEAVPLSRGAKYRMEFEAQQAGQMAVANRSQALANRGAGQPLPSTTVQTVAVSGNVIYAGTPLGLSVSQDGGQHWFSPGIFTGIFVTKIASSGSVAFAATHRGLFVSRNNGITWTEDEPLPGIIASTSYELSPSLFVRDVACDRSTVCVFEPGTPRGYYVSRDGGKTWTLAHLLVGIGDNETKVAVSGSEIYVASGFGLHISRDLGQSFMLADGLGPSWHGMQDIVQIAASNSFVCAERPQTLYVSNDNGTTWNTSSTAMAFEQPIGVNGTTICTAQIGVNPRLSLDGGSTWTNIGAFSGVGATVVNSIAVTQNAIYLATNHGLWATHDNGSSWTNYL